MWLIFLISVLVIASLTLLLLLVGNKVFIAIKRDNRNFDLESENASEYIKNNNDEKEKETNER